METLDDFSVHPHQPSVGYPSDQSRYPRVSSHINDKADLLDGRYVNGGEGADPIRTWMEETAATY